VSTTFTPEAVKAVLLGAGYTEYDDDLPDEVGFEVFKAAMGPEVIVTQNPTRILMRYNRGEGPRALLGLYLLVLDQAGYVVRSTGSEVVVAGVKEADR
jgi:hypothetical protein